MSTTQLTRFNNKKTFFNCVYKKTSYEEVLYTVYKVKSFKVILLQIKHFITRRNYIKLVFENIRTSFSFQHLYL